MRTQRMGETVKRRWFAPGAIVAACLVAALLQTGAWALTDEEIFRGFRFSFINPGARSLGMGGAIIATGNDAAAAQANPAALNYVYRSEVFLEYRHIRPETAVISSSVDIDPDSGLFLTSETVNTGQNVTLPSFFSFAYPMRIAGRRARFAVSRQAVLDVRSSLADPGRNLSTSLRIGNVGFPTGTDPNQPCPEPYAICSGAEGSLRAELIDYNLSFSYAVTDDFSVGVAASYATLDVQSDVTSLSQDPNGFLRFRNRERFPIGSGFAPVESDTAINDKDAAFAWTVGAHWHPDRAFPNRAGVSPIRFGLVYRKGPDLTLRESAASSDWGGPLARRQFPMVLHVPDRYGIGVSCDAWEHWTFALDVERIEYSDLLENFQAGVNLFGNPGIGDLLNFTLDPDKFVFTVDDATVVHAGLEFSLQTGAGWVEAARAGYFNAPDNRIRLEEVHSGNAKTDRIFKNLFRGGDDVSHYTGGYSIRAPAGLEIQAAADFSAAGDEYLISAIYRFGPLK